MNPIIADLGKIWVVSGTNGDPQRIDQVMGRIPYPEVPEEDQHAEARRISAGIFHHMEDFQGAEDRPDEIYNPSHFADKGQPERHGRGIANWPEGAKKVHLNAVCFGKLPNYDALLTECAKLPDYLEKATFPHLVAMHPHILGGMTSLHNIPFLAAPDESGLWECWTGALCMIKARCAMWQDLRIDELSMYEVREKDYFLFEVLTGH